MNRNDVSRGIVDAEAMDFGIGLVSIELVVSSIVLGLWSRSWWVFGVSLVVLTALSFIRRVAAVLFGIMTILWGIGVGLLAHWIFHSVAAGIVLGIIVAIVAAGAHIWAYEWTTSRD